MMTPRFSKKSLPASVPFAALIILLFLSGCSGQKRLYTRGYYRDQHAVVNTSPVIKSSQVVRETEPVLTATVTKEVMAAPVTDNTTQPCDTLMMNSGDKILAVVTEVTPEQVKYKTCDYQDGPIHIVHKKRVTSIHYASGLIREFGKTEDKKATHPNRDNQNSETLKRPEEEVSPELAAKISNNANASLILGVIACVSCLGLGSLFFITIPLAIIAMYTGKKALLLMDRNQGLRDRYYKKARAGRIMGIVSLVILLLTVIIGLFLFVLLLAGII
jgi:hypothetical protein